MERSSAFRRPSVFGQESCVEPQHSITASHSCALFEPSRGPEEAENLQPHNYIRRLPIPLTLARPVLVSPEIIARKDCRFMQKEVAFSFLALLAAGLLAQAGTFPLTLKTLTADEARSCPGGGSYGMVYAGKPQSVTIKAEPKAISTHPLYGRFDSEGMPGMVFRLDESKGAGKGYDRLIVDLNRNADLNDDPVFERHQTPNQPGTQDYEQGFFGPIQMPADKSAGPWKPRFYADMYIYNKRAISEGKTDPSSNIGQLRALAGAYLETTVEMNGQKQKMAVADGNCNFKLGDLSRATKVYRRPNDPGSWYLMAGDYLLRDRDNSGRFENEFLSNEAEMLSSLVYFGGQPFTVVLNQECQSLTIDPYPGPTGELAVGPNLVDLVLGRHIEADQWEGVTPEIRNGKALLPVGTYRFSAAGIKAQASGGDLFRSRTSESGEKILKIEAGKTENLGCGLPLCLQIVANKETNRGTTSSGAMGAARSLFGSTSSSASTTVVRFNMNVLGPAQEVYAGFYNTQRGMDRVPPPKFQILDDLGNQIEAGNFEYG
jgi:hypothetical protein